MHMAKERLTLKKETLRFLGEDELQRVLGGRPPEIAEETEVQADCTDIDTEPC